MFTSPNRFRPGHLLAAAALIAALAGCSSNNKSTQGSKSTAALKTTEIGTVVFSSAGRTVRVKSEVVRSHQDQMKGLMYREELCAFCGMLFIYPEAKVHTFWMKNTYISLDMIFINGEMKVMGVVENAPPLTEDSQSIDLPSRFILEVNGGFVKKHGIKAGDRVSWEGIKAK